MTPEAFAQLLSLAVHELRTPASVVSGYLRMLQRDTEAPLSERQRKMIDEAEKSCARLIALVGEMSEVSKLDAGLVRFAADGIDIWPLVKDVADGVHEADSRGVHLTVRGSAAGATVRGDAARLRTALASVFRAILREQPDATTLAVDRRVAVQDGRTLAIIIIADESRVQPAYEAAPAVFDDRRGGLGLTLPIARRIIEAHGGRVWSPTGGAERSAALVSLPLAE